MNKELNLVRARVYFKSYSEMLIPMSVVEQTLEAPKGIYSCVGMEEDLIKDIMNR